MEISYTMNSDDYRAWNLYVLTHPKPGAVRHTMHWGWLVACMIGWLWCVLRWVIFPGGGPETWLIVLLSIGTVFVFFASTLCLRLIVWSIVVRQPKADRAKMASVHTITITPEALLYASQDSWDKSSWVGVQRIAVTNDHVFFFHTSQAGHGVPRRAFASAEAFREFAETAQRYKKEAEERAASAPHTSTGILVEDMLQKLATKTEDADMRERFTDREPPPSPNAN